MGGTETWGAAMNWESFYLICFLVGLSLSAFTLLGGMGHFGGQSRPHAARRPHVPHIHIPHATHGPHAGTAGGRGGRSVVERVFDFDFSLLVWRGGIPADALRQLCRWIVLVLAASICGLIGGAIIFLFFTRCCCLTSGSLPR